MKTVDLLRMLLITLILLGSVLLANKIYLNQKNASIIEEKTIAISPKVVFKELSEEENETIYEQCMRSPYHAQDTKIAFQELIGKYKNKNISFIFEDIKNNYSYDKSPSVVYYGASIIKLLDAVYLLEKANIGEANLSEKITYQTKHMHAYSYGLEKYQVGDKISIEELIYYALNISDNAAHKMLVDYIGIENLKEYAESLGITLTINSEEYFGNMKPEYAHKILKKAYDLISLKNKNSKLLEKAMTSDYYNSLNFDTIKVLHKYGLTNQYYHDIGIYNDSTYPYLITVFTKEAYHDYETLIHDLHKDIYQIYLENISLKKTYCSKIENDLFQQKKV